MDTLKGEAEFLRVADVCEMLSLSRRTVYKLIANEELRASRIGGQYFFQRSDITRLVSGAR